MRSRRAKIVGLVCGGITAVVAACTAFDDVPAPRVAGSGDGGGGGGTDGGAEPDASPTEGLLPLALAARVCSLVARCAGLGDALAASLRVSVVEPNFSLCLTELATEVEPGRPGKSATAKVLAEVAAADTCAAAGAALFIDVFRAGDPRCAYDAAPGTPLDSCLDANTALHCFGPGMNGFLHHCGKPHRSGTETCFAFDGGADCALAEGCADQTCVGPTLELCRPNELLRLYHSRTDCTVLGMQCTVTKDNRIGCSTDGTDIRATTMKFLGAQCEGNLRHTQSEVYFGLTDCAALGARCVGGGKGALCVRPSDECSPFSLSDTCTGTTWSGCVGGKKTTFDCATIGKSCSADAAPGAVAAACY